jgi:type I restriction-modification system DNA methylase subunit
MTLGEIEDAYGEQLEPLPTLRRELAERLELAEREPPQDKEARKKFREEKKANADRLKVLKAAVKALTKLEAEAEEKRAAARQHAEREIALARETAADLERICSDPAEARRYFALVEREEIEENEFNLNLPRYVDTFKPEERIEISDALSALNAASHTALLKRRELRRLIKSNGERRSFAHTPNSDDIR